MKNTGDNIEKNKIISISYKEIIFLILVSAGLYITSLSGYLLFHGLVEVFSIAVAICIFMIAWNSKNKLENNYLLFIGISLLFTASIDLLHTLAYKGMGVFTGYDANLPTQLWIAARYLQSISLLIAPLFFYRKLKLNLNVNYLFFMYSIVFSLLIASIFYWKNFPDCFIEGKGLTTFKIVSEYVISLIMAASIYLLYKNRKEFDENVFSLLVASIIILIFSEMAFTAYASVFGFSNMLGHLFKFIAFYLIYKAIIVTGFMKPYDLIFRDLKNSEEELIKHRDHLEELVKERTAELARMNRELLAISKCNQILMRAQDEQALLNDICRIICDEAGYRMAWVGYAENDDAKTIRPVAWAGAENRYLEQARLTWADTERGRGPAGTAIRSGESTFIQDFTTDPKAAPWRESALQRGYRSCISLPLKDGKPNPFGVLIIYSTEPDAFTPDEIRLLGELAGDLAFGITVMRARIERKRAEEALQGSDQRLRLVMEASHIGVWDLDLVDHSAFRTLDHDIIFGYAELLPRWTYEMFLEHVLPEDRTMVDRKFAHAIENQSDWNFECRIRRNDGDVRWIRATGRHLSGTAGAVRRMAGIVQDITERKQAEEEIRRLNAELEQKVIERTTELNMKTGELLENQKALLNLVEDLNGATSQLEATNKELEAFSYSVSHDLRAPLRSIDGFSQALLEDYTDKLDEQGKDYLARVRGATLKMSQLIEAMLSLSRLTRGEIKPDVVNLSILAKSIADELQKTQPERKVEFVIAQGVTAKGDMQMLRIVLENFLSNAWKFTGRHPTARIEFGVQQVEGKTAYFVRDDGAGFDMSYAGKLFTAFQRLHTETEFPGIGIGLATVQRIIHRHGGKVWAEGAVEKGATFYFTL